MRYWDFIDEMREWADNIIHLLDQGQIPGAIREQNSLIGSNLLCTHYEHDEWDDSDTRIYVAEKRSRTEKECLEEIKEAWKRAWPKCSEAARANLARPGEIKSPEKFIPEDIIREMKPYRAPVSGGGVQASAEKRPSGGQPRGRARERLTYLSQVDANKK